MKLYHPKSKGSVDCHPSQVTSMKNKGWHEKDEKVEKTKSPPGKKWETPKTETKPA